MKKNSGLSSTDQSVERDVNRALSRANRMLEGSSIVKRMTYQTQVTSSGAGAAIISINSGDVRANPAVEWASFAARYTDYRVLAMKLTYLPRYKTAVNDGTNTLYAAGAGVTWTDPAGSVVVTTVAQGYALESSKLCDGCTRFKVAMRATQVEHMMFNSTGVTIPAANNMRLGFVIGALDNSTLYGNYFVEWVVELRGSQ